MVIPRFSLRQDRNTLKIIIRAPYCSLKELETSVEEDVFIFSCKPYYLQLHLPGKIDENDRSKSSFDADEGVFTFQYEKTHPGQDFPDLELITKFLRPKVVVQDGNRKIEILGEISTAAEFEEPEEYGFAMRGGYNFKLSGEFGVFEVDPLQIKLSDRQKLRQQTEQKHFSSDHYAADFMDLLQIDELIRQEMPWNMLQKDTVQFTSKEMAFMKDLSNAGYNLNEKQVNFCHNNLIEILYAYCYDKRTTCFEATCESGWTISKISATLSWFDGFASPREALICAFRRSLIYPLYRNFNLCRAVLRDLQSLLRLGEKYLVKCLIETYDIFLGGDSGRYILNNLFIKDYIIYIMKWDRKKWSEVVDNVCKTVIDKKELGLGLQQIETDTLSQNNELSMACLKIDDEDTDSDDETLIDSDSEVSVNS